MAYPALPKLLIFCLVVVLFNLGPFARAHLEDTSLKLMKDGFEWPTSMSSLYDEFDDEDVEEEEDEDTGGGSSARRSLFWRQIVRYYISYGALAANRIPCPPRSGRSYYTHNCFKARGPVQPYTRGCSRITRCRR
ncbi:Protein RALF-like 34 [Morella rubra]|uniref:Protein RALF-like 34 n=1 Tax=Morella rubra TaxID=262757 RepID=A0A6A1VPC6_9ROSI|nr:Protein RALF-like 34 [Morella rubra]